MADPVLGVAAPAAPAIPYALLALSSAIAFAVSWGLLHGWARTFGAFFQWLGNKAIAIPLPHLPDVSIHPFGFLLTLDQQIRAGLGQAVAATEHAMVTSFHRMVGIIQWTGQEIAGLATDTYNAIRNIEHSVVNHVTKVITHTVVKPITTVVKGASAITKAQFNHLTHRVDVLRQQVARLTHAAGHAIASPFPRIGRLEKTAKSQAKRLSKLEKLLAAGVGVALLIKAMTKLGLGWLRCGNVKKAGKNVCSMDAGLLDALLTGTLLIAGTISLVEFAEEVQSITDEASGLIHGFLREA